MRDIEDQIPVEMLFEFFEVDFDAGILRWKPREVTCEQVRTWNKRFAGKEIRNINTDGVHQVYVTIDGVKYYSVVHRVIWAMANGRWPGREFHLDHRDHDRSANGLSDTRLATPTQNMRNKRVYKNNSSGFKGVSYYPRYEKWMVSICINKRLKNLGYFDDKVEAARVYDAAAVKHFGEFAKTNASLGLL